MTEVRQEFEAIISEVSRRRRFDLRDFCFKEQLAFIKDPARFKAADCSRRAGKTVGIAADLIDTAQTYPGMASLYVTLSRLNAKRILWRDLLAINRDYEIGGKPHETELTLTLPNGHIIYLSGAKDKAEVEKYRGFPLKKVYIDEAQSFRAYLQDLVDDVLSKSLYDFNGVLALTGTPPPVPVGYFHDCVHSKEWSRHSWTMMQNPHLKVKSGRDPMEMILEDCKRMGVTIDHPKIQRECFGRWTRDLDSLVFCWTLANHFDSEPTARKWQNVLGIDIGYDDADAFSVIGWNEHAPICWQRKEVVKRKQGITELIVETELLIKNFDPIAIVMDTGGLGKKIAEELRRRYAIPIKAAEKTRKNEFIELLNDALRTKHFMARKESQFAHDSLLLEWDRDKSTGDRLVVSDNFHSDICDATLYAYREALHWLHEPEKTKPKFGSREWAAAQEDIMERAVEEGLNRDKDDPAQWGDPDSWGMSA